MDLVYKIYSVWLYDNQLNHDFIILYNRKMSFIKKELEWDIPYAYSDIFNEIHKLNDSVKREKSIELMKMAHFKTNKKSKESILIENNEFLTIEPFGEPVISYSGSGTGEKIKEGKYKGLYKKVYRPYNIYWNETKSGINIHEWEVAGIWNIGCSYYTSYRIWEEKSERSKELLDNKLNTIFYR